MTNTAKGAVLSRRNGNKVGGSDAIQILMPTGVEVVELTYSALTGIRKQSVEDVECLFGPGVISFMEKHGYDAEAEIVKTVRNWRRAMDERGLSEEQRRQFCDDFLNFILHDWMPWHREVKDFSVLEVNRL